MNGLGRQEIHTVDPIQNQPGRVDQSYGSDRARPRESATSFGEAPRQGAESRARRGVGLPVAGVVRVRAMGFRRALAPVAIAADSLMESKARNRELK